MTSVVVGCPVWHREWVLRPWFLFVEEACAVAEMEPVYAFVVDHHDTATADAISDGAAGRAVHLVRVGEDQDQNRRDRVWNPDRYHHMVWLRNALLEAVRRIDPDLFLSLDSDILLHEDALASMVATLAPQHWDAVGSKCYLTPTGTQCPNYAMLANCDSLARPDSTLAFTVDAIMAIKLMSRPAYGVDYEFHFHGEDIGWSKAAHTRGVRIGWDGSVCSKHVMNREQIDLVDRRCGY